MSFGICFTVTFLCIIAIAIDGAGFPQGTGPIILDDVRCSGNESSLLSCRHGGIGVIASCYHSDDAGVVCPPCKLRIFLVQLIIFTSVLLSGFYVTYCGQFDNVRAYVIRRCMHHLLIHIAHVILWVQTTSQTHKDLSTAKIFAYSTTATLPV